MSLKKEQIDDYFDASTDVEWAVEGVLASTDNANVQRVGKELLEKVKDFDNTIIKEFGAPVEGTKDEAER